MCCLFLVRVVFNGLLEMMMVEIVLFSRFIMCVWWVMVVGKLLLMWDMGLRVVCMGRVLKVGLFMVDWCVGN